MSDVYREFERELRQIYEEAFSEEVFRIPFEAILNFEGVLMKEDEQKRLGWALACSSPAAARDRAHWEGMEAGTEFRGRFQNTRTFECMTRRL